MSVHNHGFPWLLWHPCPERNFKFEQQQQPPTVFLVLHATAAAVTTVHLEPLQNVAAQMTFPLSFVRQFYPFVFSKYLWKIRDSAKKQELVMRSQLLQIVQYTIGAYPLCLWEYVWAVCAPNFGGDRHYPNLLLAGKIAFECSSHQAIKGAGKKLFVSSQQWDFPIENLISKPLLLM